jgi:pimeloyl-ACP methyl ester carboxylesterase
MHDQTQDEKVTTPRRRGRGCGFWLGASFVSVLGLMLVGYIYEPFAEATDAKAYPPPGQLVDVGGHRLHINCTGSGSPTVVIEAGLGDWSTSWGFVQSEVAKTTRVCTYDRAGAGWSDPGPLPRDAAQFAKELHTLLQKADVPGPYVMVGHSLGGFGVRVFVHEYASDVAGVVLIESMSPKQLPQLSTQVGPQPNMQSLIYSVFTGLARVGAVRLLVRPVTHLLSTETLPTENVYYSRFVRTQSMQTARDESRSLQASGAEAAAVKDFGDLPLIVLTGRLHTDPPDWQTWQTELLQLSSTRQQLFAENGNHGIQFEQPEAASAAILQMVQQVRQTAKK